jgi:hypothetical protein
LTLPAEYPQRVLPLRSKISDNLDEFIFGRNDGTTKANWDEVAARKQEASKKLKNAHYLEKQALADLTKAGVEPIQHPGGFMGLTGIRAFNMSVGGTFGF